MKGRLLLAAAILAALSLAYVKVSFSVEVDPTIKPPQPITWSPMRWWLEGTLMTTFGFWCLLGTLPPYFFWFWIWQGRKKNKGKNLTDFFNTHGKWLGVVAMWVAAFLVLFAIFAYALYPRWKEQRMEGKFLFPDDRAPLGWWETSIEHSVHGKSVTVAVRNSVRSVGPGDVITIEDHTYTIGEATGQGFTLQERW